MSFSRGTVSKKSPSKAELGEGNDDDNQPKIKYSGALTLKAYEDAGFPFEDDNQYPAELFQCIEFLRQVDITKKPRKIVRTLSTIGRLKAVSMDPNSKTHKRTMGEFLIYTENWGIPPDWSVNHLGERIAPVTGNLEGVHKVPETKIEISDDYYDNRRRTQAGYVLAGSHLVYEIPFSKKAVDEILQRYDIDKDSSEVKYYFFKGDGSTTLHSDRTTDYTYKQFTESTYDEMYQLAVRPGGPKATFPTDQRKI